MKAEFLKVRSQLVVKEYQFQTSNKKYDGTKNIYLINNILWWFVSFLYKTSISNVQ